MTSNKQPHMCADCAPERPEAGQPAPGVMPGSATAPCDCAAQLADCCEIPETHPGVVTAVCQGLPPLEALQDLAALFKALGDPTRVRILAALALRELCVCDLCAILDMSQSAVSHQLRLLRTARLVRFRRDGKNVFYSLDDEHVLALFAQGLEHVRHDRP